MDFNTNSPYWYGLRHESNQPKASGFFGELPVPGTNHKATEYSADVDINGRNVQIPTIVPTLSGGQLGGLLGNIAQDQPPSDSVMQKAIDHARFRMAMGQSPFWRIPERQQPMPTTGLLGTGLFGIDD